MTWQNMHLRCTTCGKRQIIYTPNQPWVCPSGKPHHVVRVTQREEP